MSNNDGVVLYYSSVSSSTKVKKDTQNLKWLLEKKHCAFDEVDVATKPPALFTLLQKKSGKKTLPQLYVDGKFIGGYDECQELEEIEQLDKVLEN